MGVPGLWKELAPAAQTRSLTELAVAEGFEANPNGLRGFRVGIDASIWFFHAEYGKEGDNPQLRTLFFRCATLMHAPFLPLFVFDGPLRPKVKRGKTINKAPSNLTNGMKQIVEAFGFEWRTAPGEAEAELAYLNRIGVIDGVLSDDVDNFLFGATTVIRNPSNNLSGNRANPVLNADGRDDKNHTRVYRMHDIQQRPDVSLTRGDMIFMSLCSGGDYDTSGMTGCGLSIAKGLVRYGFGRSLYEAARNLPEEDLPAFLHTWRDQLRHELRTDSKGFIGSKRRALASAIPDTFPDIDILLSYVRPCTSESKGRASDNLKLTWSKEPNLGMLAKICERYFEWGYRDSIIKRFRTVIWPGIVLRILRRAVVDGEERRARPATPTKSAKRAAVPGTPSKLITRHFSSLTLNPVEDDEDDRLITKITLTRRHASTDGILEYRVEIRPRQLVLLAESGIDNTLRPVDEDPWAESGDEKEVLTPEERRAREESKLLVWMPASMMRMAEPRIVEEFEKLEEDKRRKKAEKGTKRPRAKPKAATALDEEGSKTKTSRATTRKAKVPVACESGSDAPGALPQKAKVKSKAPAVREETSGSDVPFRSERPQKTAKAKSKAASIPDTADDELPTFELDANAPMTKANNGVATANANDAPDQSPTRLVRDLTKRREKTVASNSQKDLKNFFPLAKAVARSKTSVQPSAPLSSVTKSAVSKQTVVSAPVPRQIPVPARLFLEEEEESEESDSGVQVPPKAQQAKKAVAPASLDHERSDVENKCTLMPRPFPLLFDDRPLPRRRTSIGSSDSDSRSSRVTKSPRKSAEHTSPRKKASAAATRALSPTPLRRPANTVPVIDISSDSDSSPRRRPAAHKAVLRPANVSIIDLSDL
ncbi:hypothetical protein GGX14DRAFT_492239 [Mycena pura]|uniref:XPG-I domain-containing protein n=1 Tax=Mycena pura TaxID=153505 RepID=A0AAD7E0I2_9AGAR|nr:hypothetical protein GGX14DRAFT_492239 [Mycena pura]